MSGSFRRRFFGGRPVLASAAVRIAIASSSFPADARVQARL